jgi:hypothetical protein
MTQWGLDTLFNPAKRHMDEEKQRLQATREDIGDASGGKRIDFESGKVVIRRPAKPADPASVAETAIDEDASIEPTSDDQDQPGEPAVRGEAPAGGGSAGAS